MKMSPEQVRRYAQKCESQRLAKVYFVPLFAASPIIAFLTFVAWPV